MIYLNGDNSQQPSSLQEDTVQKLVDRTTILGVTHRYWEAQKYKVVMTFSAIDNTQWLLLMSYCANGANPVTYYNSSSTFNFTGFATTTADVFIKGGSYLRNMTITLIQQ